MQQTTVREALLAVEPGLCHARENLITTEPSEGNGIALPKITGACRGFLDILRAPEWNPVDPVNLVTDVLYAVDADHFRAEMESVPSCVGDERQLTFLLRILLDGVEREPETGLSLMVTQLQEREDEEPIPILLMALEGPGRVPDPIAVGADIVLPLEALDQHWTAATRGGRIDRQRLGWNLRFAGVRKPPPPVSDLAPLLDAVIEADRRVRLLTSGERIVSDEREETLAAIDKALEVVHGPSRREPSAFGPIVEEGRALFESERPGFTGQVETEVSADIPAIAISRRHLVSFVRHALCYGARQVRRGGRITIQIGYAVPERVLELQVVIAGTKCRRDPESCYEAALRWTIEAVHGGVCHIAEKRAKITIAATLPDPVGQALDAEFPGWERFTAPSQQMLRLMRSGGEALPRDVLLSGILETELEASLLPRLTEPAVVNRAHELSLDDETFPGASSEQRGKALAQICRGKPKKELTQPAYAAELLWAFRKDEAHRDALGIQGFDEDGLRRLCISLKQSPPDGATAVPLVAAARAASNTTS